MDGRLGCWAELTRAGAGLAMVRMSQLTGHGIESSSALVRPGDVARHWRGPGAVAVGVGITLSGAGSGRIMMMYEPDSAKGFADLLMGRRPGTTDVLGEAERSALGRFGRAVAGSFLRTVVTVTGFDLSLSPPSVLVADPDTMLSAIAGDAAWAPRTANLTETTFVVAGTQLRGVFLAVPNRDLLRMLPSGLPVG